jgi:ABC-type multidrug transport system fused ATPase/permease subunit
MGSKMTQMLLTFVWIGLGLGSAKFIYISCVEYVCSSQVLKYKIAFLKAVLRQDVAWYDSSSPEELTTRFEMSMHKVQKGLSAPAFMLFEGLGYGLTSFIMGFVYHPETAGITLATVPLLIISASVMMYIVEKGGKIVTSAYGKAGGIATEALFSMRTIKSLGIEDQFEERYSQSLSGARNATIRNTTAFGLSAGCAISAYLVMMAASIMYGAFTLAGEMEDSSFDFVVPIGDGRFNHYCANTKNQPTGNVTSTSSSAAVCSPPMQSFKMSCQTASAYAAVGAESLGFDNEEDFLRYLQANAPTKYIESNNRYYDCMLPSTDVLLAIFAIMMVYIYLYV